MSQIDASLGELEDRVRREASEEFWRYVGSSAHIYEGSRIQRAAQISGLTPPEVRWLASLHWILSDEVASLLQCLPQLMPRVIRTTKTEMTLGDQVTGMIDWPATIAARANAGWRSNFFASNTAQAIVDTPENRVLKATLESVSRFTGQIAELNAERIDDKANFWTREARLRASIAKNAFRSPILKEVRAPSKVSDQDIRLCSNHSVRGYRRAASAARLRRILVDKNDPQKLDEMLAQRVLAPGKNFRLFEIWILARVASFFRARQCRELSSPLLVDNQSGPVYRFAPPTGGVVEIYFQGLPHVMRVASEYSDILRAYDLDSGSRTPDLVVQRGGDLHSPRVIIEAKASDESRYLSDGVYKLLGYLLDFNRALPKPSWEHPVGLLVSKNRGAYLERESRDGHRFWISNAHELDLTLEKLLQPFA